MNIPVFSWINRIISRLGASPGSSLKKPGLAPKRLIQSGAVQRSNRPEKTSVLTRRSNFEVAHFHQNLKRKRSNGSVSEVMKA